MRASMASCGATSMAFILRLLVTPTASNHLIYPRSDGGLIHGRCAPLALQELRLHFVSRCTLSTIDGVPHWSTFGTPSTARERVVEHGLVTCTVHFDHAPHVLPMC